MTEAIYPPDYPYQPKTIVVGGYRLAYLDTVADGKTILMVHGNPVSGFVFTRLLQRLSKRHRCVVPDLLGFGLSDKPSDESVYTLRLHINLLAEMIQRLDLRDVVLVVHDWGGPIGFGAALQEPERYSHLVILNTMTEAPMKIRPLYWLPYRILLRARCPADYLVRERNLFQRLGVGIMDPADQAVYFRANSTADKRAGIAAFPRLIPYHRQHPSFKLLQRTLQAVIAWDLPAIVLFSDRDSVFTAAQGRRLAEQMVNARFQLVPGARHFLQYEQPELIAGEIQRLIH